MITRLTTVIDFDHGLPQEVFTQVSAAFVGEVRARMTLGQLVRAELEHVGDVNSSPINLLAELPGEGWTQPEVGGCVKS